MRGIDGFNAPPDDDPTGAPIAKFFAVGGGGRIVRGPAVLPVKGESALVERSSDVARAVRQALDTWVRATWD